ncbi:MAG: hypothetical protein KAS65_12725 [Candidatus Aminicenantes bacterium]|nr:hypothetical protein [Candidatus Aminicenantes bacterium]
MIQQVNFFITKIFDVILYPFGFLGDFWAILFLSVLISLIVLVIFKYISSPTRIKDTKNKIKSSILAIRLYKDFWRVITGSFLKSLFYTMKYFMLNIGPVLIIIPILFPIFVQMDIRYGMRPFEPDDIFVFKVRLNSDLKDIKIRLLDSDHFKPVMNPVFINAYEDDERTIPIREVNWKLKCLKPDRTDIRVQVNRQVISKNLVIGKNPGSLSNKKMGKSSVGHFIYPAEKLIENAGPVDTLYLQYPAKSVSLLGLKAHWLIYHLILVIIIVLALRKRFGVEF